MFGPTDLDVEEQYPGNGTLEEKALFSLHQMRNNFYWQKRNYDACKEGGGRYNATLLAQGPKSAQHLAKMAERNFESYCKQAYVTKDGEASDPKYPVDKMINSELRRIRMVVILNVSQYIEQFRQMMPENVMDWTVSMIYHNLAGYKHRYAETLYEDINVVIPNKKLPPRSLADIEDLIDKLATKYSDKNVLDGANIDFISDRIRDEMIEFLLVDIPYNKQRLDGKTALIADEVVQKPAEEKPVLH